MLYIHYPHLPSSLGPLSLHCSKSAASLHRLTSCKLALQLTEETLRCPKAGVAWGLGAGNNIGCPPILYFGTEAQRQDYLPRVYRGEIRFCLGITEPQGTSPHISTSDLLNDGFI